MTPARVPFLLVVLCLALAAPSGARAQVTEWAAITSGRMVDIYDVEHSDERLLQNGLSMLRVARAAYSNSESERREAVEAAHYRVVGFVDEGSTSTQVLIVRDATRAVVAVRGTARGDRHDEALDLASITTPLTGTYPDAHVGFVSAAQSVLSRVSGHLADLLAREGVREIWFTGHSLGGAVAQLLAWRFHGWGYPVEGIVSFGAPPVGKHHWSAAYGSLAGRTHLWENHEDWVPCSVPDQAQWSQNGALHVLHAGGATLYQRERRCTELQNPNPDSILCNDDVVQWLAMGFLGQWHLAATCALPDPFQGFVELLADLVAGRGPAQHRVARYWDRLSSTLPAAVVRRLTGG